MRDLQAKDFRSISSLDAVSLALASVPCDDGKVQASDCENSASVLGVWVERVCLWLGRAAGRHYAEEEVVVVKERALGNSLVN